MKRYTKPGILIVELASEVIMNTGSVSDGKESLNTISSGGTGGTVGDNNTVWGDARQHHGFDVWDNWD